MTRQSFQGAKHTVDTIRALAVPCQQDYNLVRLRDEIIGRLESKDYLSEILACYFWVLAHTRYANDPRNVELVRSPREILHRIRERLARLRSNVARFLSDPSWRPSLDCDDLVSLMVGLFLCLGRQVQIVTVAFRHQFANGERQYSHVFLRVREPRTGTWVVLDPVAAEGAAGMLARAVAFKIWPVA